MRRWYLAAPLIAAAFIAACSDSPTSNPTAPTGRTASALLAPLSGAISTTFFPGCTVVNGNIYQAKTDVGLSGLPNVATVPDGSYWVQVTAPNGTVLGKSATADYVVSGGVAPCLQLWALVNSASSGFTAAGYDDTPNPGGEYKAWISTGSDFVNNQSKTDNFKVRNPNGPPPPPPVSLTVQKYYDANANGVMDSGEPLITGWEFTLTSWTTSSNEFTTYNQNLDVGTYATDEWGATGWMHTGVTASDMSQVSAITGFTHVAFELSAPLTISYGNVCFAPEGGLTLGFWSNKNGAALFTSSGTGNDLSMLVGLNLRNANGSAFDPTNYTAFRTWLLNASATNMAYMLSAQLSAMELNVAHGKVDGTLLVYAPGATGANSLGFISINSLMAEANTSLGNNGYTVASGATRTYQEALKTALDNANNNLNIVSPTPCTTPTSFIAPTTPTVF